MKLQKYLEKRDFKKSPEPSAEEKSGKGPLAFVVQKHHARRLHYDFRLELEGVLKSWAVPKGPSINPEDKRLAVMVEDHPFEYRNFEGIIPEGNYGAGDVIIWDEGFYRYPEISDRKISEEKLSEGLKKGHLPFELFGKKLNGRFELVKIRAREKNVWLLIKAKDNFSSQKDILRKDFSVRTGRRIQEKERISMPHGIKPMLAVLGEGTFDKEGWIFEIKWDGYRAISEIEKGTPKIFSRREESFNSKFPEIVRDLTSIKEDVILDGEIVALSPEGRAEFQLLQNYTEKKAEVRYYVFDILYLSGKSLMVLPLFERKKNLENFLKKYKFKKILYADHILEKGKGFYNAAVREGIEGIMAKNGASQYFPGKRTKDWIKIKARMREEAVIGGFTEPRGSRKYLGALILGKYKDGDLVYIGHTGGGADKNLKEIRRMLDKLEIPKSPFKNTPKPNAPVHWVRPELVSEVVFQEWSKDGIMRAPILLGIREDKAAKEVVEEEKILGSEKVKFSNLGKIFWPKEKYTKGDLIEYYKKISKFILSYIKGRPQSLNRHPNGIDRKSFFQKNISEIAPDWARTIIIKSDTEERDIEYFIADDEDSLLFMANLGCIEINPWNSKVEFLENPDWTILDLDPGDIGFENVVECANGIHKILEKISVKSFVKTSGKKGLHILIPLGAKYSYTEAKVFAEIIARTSHNLMPDFTSVIRDPKKREDKVYIDYLQNRKGQTLAAPYSLRPVPGALVSTPLEWKEVKQGLSPEDFNMKNIFKRLEKKGDLFKGLLGPGVDLEKASDKLQKMFS